MTTTTLRYGEIEEGDELAVCWEGTALLRKNVNHGTVKGTVHDVTDIGREIAFTDDDGNKYRYYCDRPSKPIEKTTADGDFKGTFGKVTSVYPRDAYESAFGEMDI